MSVEYTYEIIAVDPAAKAMEIVYTSPVHGVLHVGARMPWKGERVEDIVRMYEPTRYWAERAMEVEPVAIGSSGSSQTAQPEPDPAAMIEAFRLAVDAHVEATAQSKGYNSAAHCASYVASTHAPWAAEATAFVAWRDQVWLFVFQQLALVEAGTAPPPSSSEELIAMLPQIEW